MAQAALFLLLILLACGLASLHVCARPLHVWACLTARVGLPHCMAQCTCQLSQHFYTRPNNMSGLGSSRQCVTAAGLDALPGQSVPPLERSASDMSQPQQPSRAPSEAPSRAISRSASTQAGPADAGSAALAAAADQHLAAVSHAASRAEQVSSRRQHSRLLVPLLSGLIQFCAAPLTGQEHIWVALLTGLVHFLCCSPYRSSKFWSCSPYCQVKSGVALLTGQILFCVALQMFLQLWCYIAAGVSTHPESLEASLCLCITKCF